MPSSLSPRRIVEETVPVAAVLLFWTVLSLFAFGTVLGTGLRLAGVVMAVAYVVGRGVALADEATGDTVGSDLEAVLVESVHALAGAGLWFVLGALVYAGERFVALFEAVGLPVFSGVEAFAWVFTGTGVAAVLLYAVVTAGPVVRRGRSEGTDAAPADD